MQQRLGRYQAGTGRAGLVLVQGRIPRGKQVLRAEWRSVQLLVHVGFACAALADECK